MYLFPPHHHLTANLFILPIHSSSSIYPFTASPPHRDTVSLCHHATIAHTHTHTYLRLRLATLGSSHPRELLNIDIAFTSPQLLSKIEYEHRANTGVIPKSELEHTNTATLIFIPVIWQTSLNRKTKMGTSGRLAGPS